MEHKIYDVEVSYHILIEADSCNDAEAKVRAFLRAHPGELDVIAMHQYSFEELKPRREET